MRQAKSLQTNTSWDIKAVIIEDNRQYSKFTSWLSKWLAQIWHKDKVKYSHLLTFHFKAAALHRKIYMCECVHIIRYAYIPELFSFFLKCILKIHEGNELWQRKKLAGLSLCGGAPSHHCSEQRCPSISSPQTALELEQPAVMVPRSWYDNKAKQSIA